MRKGIILTIAVLAAGSLLSAQVRRDVGVVPASSMENPEDIGVRSHTNYFIYAPDGVVRPMANPGGETPGSLGCVYDLVSSPVSGCPIATSTEVPTGGSGVIVIVDAYHYPSAFKDLSAFSKEFGLPPAKLSVQYASGKPANGCSSGWQLEEALDIQWAHAMAPNAQIVLMEAKSNLNTDLYAAVKAANSYIAQHGGKGEVHELGIERIQWRDRQGCTLQTIERRVLCLVWRFSGRQPPQCLTERCLCRGHEGQPQWRRQIYEPDGVEQWRGRHE